MKTLNRKGFTLIELLAVIVVLAIVLVVTIPAVLSSMQTARQKQFNNMITTIEEYARKQIEACKVGDPSLAPYNNEIFDPGTCNISSGRENVIVPAAGYSIGNKEDCNSSQADLCFIKINSDGNVLYAKSPNNSKFNNQCLKDYATGAGFCDYSESQINNLTEEEKQAYVDDIADYIMQWFIEDYIHDNQDPLNSSADVWFIDDYYLRDAYYDMFPQYRDVIDSDKLYIYKSTNNGVTTYCLDVVSLQTSTYGERTSEVCQPR